MGNERSSHCANTSAVSSPASAPAASSSANTSAASNSANTPAASGPTSTSAPSNPASAPAASAGGTPALAPQTINMPLRVFLYLAGVLICGIGVVLSARSNFGAPAFQSVPLVFSEGTHLLTLGQSCMVLYCIDIAIQVIVFRKVSAKVLLQLPFAILFGLLIDLLDATLALDLFWFCHNPNLAVSCIMFAVGIVGIGVGVSAMVAMDFVLNPADGCTQALMHIIHLPFGKAKIINDVARVCIATVMSFALCGYLLGVGVGTFISMFAIGAICQVVSGWLAPLYRRAYILAGE